jgi:general secretion pathway protein F
MRRFHYRALGQTGVEVEGELAADDERDAAAQLQRTGNFPIEVTPAATSSTDKSRSPASWRLSARELTLFTRQLGTLLSAGVIVDRALALLAADRRRSRRARLATGLLAAVNRGESLSHACAEHPALARHYAMVIAAGEARGDVGPAFERLASVLERDRAINQSLANALVYPASVLVVACLSISFLLGYVVPRFEALLTTFRHEVPLGLRWLLAVSQGFQDYGLPVALLAVAAIVFILLRRRDAGFRLAVDRWLLSLPAVGALLGKVEVERFAFLLGNLVEAGVQLPAAMAATRAAMTNEAMRAGIAAAERGVERGDSLAAALGATGLLPDIALELVSVGEETGNLAPMLVKASETLRNDFEATTTRLIGLVAPVSMVVLGLLIGMIAFALFGAVMEVYDIAG